MSRIMGTESICPYCMKVIPAWYEVIDEQVFLCKECAEHGKMQTLFWRDADMYRNWLDKAVHAPKNRDLNEPASGCPFDCGVCAEHEGGVCTAVLEITYRCNMGCKICFADATKETYEPDLADIRTLYETAQQYGGDCSIQLSGGEPTVREDLPEIIRMGKEMGFSHIQVNTNGLRLAQDPEYAQLLKAAGADLIFLQFDSTEDAVNEQIRGIKLFEAKCKAIEHCRRAELGVLLVPTVIPGVNLEHLGAIVAFAKANMPIVKGIHFQPVSYFGRHPNEIPPDSLRCGLCDIIHGLEAQTGGEIHHRFLSQRERFDPHCAFSGLFYLTEEGVLQGILPETADHTSEEVKDYAGAANRFTNARWRYQAGQSEADNTSLMQRFAERLASHSLSITGMGFQDVWNVDIGRLRGCCVHVIASGGRAVPLCAFHLTGLHGERLYRNES